LKSSTLEDRARQLLERHRLAVKWNSPWLTEALRAVRAEALKEVAAKVRATDLRDDFKEEFARWIAELNGDTKP
jgi:hypothetical protein